MKTSLGAFQDGFELSSTERAYPKLLRDLAAPPERLYVRGRSPELLDGPALAVIGSRDATPYGKAATELAVRIAVEAGLTIVSGGAVGCDGMASREALRRGGRQIVVLGCGADVAYPKRHAGMFRRIVDSGGLIVSLEPWGMQPRRYCFPKRNVVIAALARAVFIAEARAPSGTFSTAAAALDLGRDVLAVPGSIFSPTSGGTNYLISEGAVCVADEDALETALARIFNLLRHEQGMEPATPGSDPDERRVVRALTATPMTMADLATALALPGRRAGDVVGRLLLKGLVVQLRDGRYGASDTAYLLQTSFGHHGVP